MKCPTCKSEMVKGYAYNGMFWYSEKSFWIRIMLFKDSPTLIVAWKCTGCGKIELIANKEIK